MAFGLPSQIVGN